MEGYTEFDYLNPPEIKRRLELIFFNGEKHTGEITWDTERRMWLFIIDENFYDDQDIQYWKYL